MPVEPCLPVQTPARFASSLSRQAGANGVTDADTPTSRDLTLQREVGRVVHQIHQKPANSLPRPVGASLVTTAGINTLLGLSHNRAWAAARSRLAWRQEIRVKPASSLLRPDGVNTGPPVAMHIRFRQTCSHNCSHNRLRSPGRFASFFLSQAGASTATTAGMSTWAWVDLQRPEFQIT